MNIYGEKYRDFLIFFGGVSAWISIVSQFFINPDLYVENRFFMGPYVYIFSLAFVVFVMFVFNKNKIFIGSEKKMVFYSLIFIILSILGVLWGGLLFGAIVNSPNSEITPKYYRYCGHYFFSSTVFYLVFFRLNKELMGLFSKFLYWFYILLLSLVIVGIFFSI